jgi:glycosyltransferase involved in cell wall biosynthesis
VPQAARRALGHQLEVHEIVAKDAGASEQAFTALLASAHFLLHPSRSTCFGVTICEANAWAVPALACRTGGVDSVIVDGRNGFGFPATAGPEAYAARIAAVFSDRDAYRDLCRAAWIEYATRLNWSTSSRAIAALLQELA